MQIIKMNTSSIIIAIFAILESLFIGVIEASDCFDALNKLPKDKIRAIYRMKFQDIANTQPAADILSCYLIKSRHGDKTTTEQNFDIYKKCNDYKKDKFQHIGYEELHELVELGLPYSLESYLRDAIQIGTTERKTEAILYIQEVMSKKIELSKEYKDYKEMILKKFILKEAALPHSESSKNSIYKISVKKELDDHEGNEKILTKKHDTDLGKTSLQEKGSISSKKHRLEDQQTKIPAAESCQKSTHHFFPIEFINWMYN